MSPTSMLRRRLARVLPWVWFGLACGCATYSDRTLEARDALLRGDLEASERQFNRSLRVRSSRDLPERWKKDTGLAVLERATVLQARRVYDTSARDFVQADKELELLDLHRDAAGKIGQFIYSDSAPKYKASPIEKLSLNAMNLVNFLVRGDLEGARVEARRFTVTRTYLREARGDKAKGAESCAFGSYLAGFVFERLGDTEEALRYYDEALAHGALESLREPVTRLSRGSAYRGERLGAYLEAAAVATPAPVQGSAAAVATPAPAASGDSALARPPFELLVLVKTGRVPYKEPRRIPIGLAVGLAGTFITGNPAILEHSAFKVVSYPELVAAGNAYDEAALEIDGRPVALDLVSDLGQEIVAEYEIVRPKIIGAALTRMIVRAAAAEGARVAGQQAQQGGSILGFLAAAVVEGTLVALDRPDTRSWTTLPDRVFVARAQLAEGSHVVAVHARGPGGTSTAEHRIEAKAGRFVVLDLTTLR